ncbi:MAG: DUF3106 domain-containing protein [Burkholderiaceae bacterium]
MRHEITFISSVRACAFITLVTVLPFSVAVPVVAQNTSVTVVRPAPKSVTKSGWVTLSAQQQQALAPLSADWDSLDATRQKKWLGIVNKFPSLKPEERIRAQNRMRVWVELSPEQRRIARENYWRAKKINPIQKNTHWQEYQQLPDAQKKSLAAIHASKKRVATLSKARKNNGVNNTLTVKSKKIPAQQNPAQDKDSSIVTPSAPLDTK